MAASIFLVGPMGAGKTTIGRQLAKQLGFEFLDSDAVIEERTGADIPWIFDVEGEEGFREREAQVIDELTQMSELVLATGGGVVMRVANRQHLAARGRVVYLHTTVNQQLARTRNSKNRPLLQTEDPRARLQALYDVRDPLYREIADLTVETDGRKVKDIVHQLVKALKDPDSGGV